MILHREVFFPIFRQHREGLVGKWHAFRTTHAGAGSHDTRLSVWLAHACVLAGRLVGDERWNISYLSATLANVHWRENARLLRASPETRTPIALPHEHGTTYYRMFGRPPLSVHAVASVRGEISDLSASVLHDPRLGVSCDPCVWAVIDCSSTEHTGMPEVSGAAWESYSVITPPREEFERKYVEARDEAAHVLRNYLLTAIPPEHLVTNPA